MKPKANLQKNLALNTYGVFFYFFAQWLLTIIVTRVSGFVAAGQYSLAVSFANLFSFVGMFGVRGLQVSDINHRYTDGQYYALRFVTCAFAVVMFAVVLPFRQYDREITLCCIAMLAFKIMECVFDVTIGTMQRNEQFAWVAVSYTVRGVLPAVAFVATLLLGGALPLAIAIMALMMLLSFAVYDIPRLARAPKEENRFRLTGTAQILKESLPLMLTALLDALLIYIPRDAVEKALGSEALGYYSTVSIVVVVLSTLGSGVWGSIMPRISSFIHGKDYKSVEKTIKIVAIAMVVVSAAVLFFGSLLGPFFFKLIFGPEILDYMFLLVPVLANALLLLANSFYQCVLIPLKHRNVLLYTDAVAAAACLVLSNVLVRNWGLVGACLGLTFSLALRCVLLAVILWRVWTKNKKEDDL